MTALLTGRAKSFKKSYAVVTAVLVLLEVPLRARADTLSRPVVDGLHVTEGQCLRRAALGAGVAAWLGRDTMAAPLAIDVDELQGGAQFVLRRDGEVLGRRTLLQPGSSCEEIRAAISLAIAVAVDATILDTLGVPRVAPPPPLPAPTFPGPMPPSARPPPWSVTPARPAPPSRRFAAGLELGFLAGLLPAPTFLISPFLSYAISPLFEVRIAGVATSPGSADLLGGGASLRITAARLDACAVERAGSIWLRACMGALAGGLSASGFGYTRTYAPTSAWLAIAGRIDARWVPRERLGLIVAVDGLFTPEPHDFEVHDGRGQILAVVPLSSAGVAISAGPFVTF